MEGADSLLCWLPTALCPCHASSSGLLNLWLFIRTLSFMVFFPLWRPQLSLLVTSVDRSCYIFFLCQPKNVICSFHTLFSQEQKREHQVSPKWERGGREVASSSLCSLSPPPPTAAEERHRRMGESEKRLLNSADQRRMGLHSCSHTYFSLVLLLLEMVQSPDCMCRAGSLGKVWPCPILLLNWAAVH